jgi:hypothetical protein
LRGVAQEGDGFGRKISAASRNKDERFQQQNRFQHLHHWPNSLRRFNFRREPIGHRPFSLKQIRSMVEHFDFSSKGSVKDEPDPTSRLKGQQSQQARVQREPSP